MGKLIYFTKARMYNMPTEINCSAQYAMAKLILDKYGRDKELPIVALANSFGFKVYVKDLGSDLISGYIFISEENIEMFGTDKIIVVNERDNYGHRRFTIAHELNHFFYDYKPEDGPYLEYSNTDVELNEKECKANAFARSLLMPVDEFVNEFKKIREGNTLDIIVEKLANRFGVSLTAVLRRIDELKIDTTRVGGT